MLSRSRLLSIKSTASLLNHNHNNTNSKVLINYPNSQFQNQQRRMFFGLGEVLGVISNPSEVLKSLTESRKLLEEARQEMRENAERAQIPTSHTFAPLPGFFNRPNEIKVLERALSSLPKFTVLFGASSVGKTALLRQVLSIDTYHCLHFDLRVAGFADIESLYLSLSNQMEAYFSGLPQLMGTEWGWDIFEKESWAFKHDRLAIEKRLELGGNVRTSDISHLMELFQSALLKYWEFKPMSHSERKASEEKLKQEEKVQPQNRNQSLQDSHDPTESKMREGSLGGTGECLVEARTVAIDTPEGEKNGIKSGGEGERPPVKKIPVFFLDEAHKLPALIRNPDAMKAILDSMLVITKQDRLCHVIHATSDPFYMQWLRKFNIMQHCSLISIGDCSKVEARKFFEQDLLPHVPDLLKSKFKFEEIYNVFGGKLAHLSDYTTEFINADGNLTPIQSSHFLQAYSLLNLQLVHSMSSNPSSFDIHSPLHNSPLPSPTASTSETEEPPPVLDSEYNFTENDLRIVMKRLASSNEKEYKSIPYFQLCRELGVHQCDSLVKNKVVELRWSPTVTVEGDEVRKEGEMFGPVLVPTTRVVGFAMEVIIKELEAADMN